jgi:hypothetical protein
MTDLHYLPVSLGEAMDKLSILDIKLDKITDNRRDNVKIEYDMLHKQLQQDLEKYTLYYNIMKIVNTEIWDMMNLLRDAEEYNHDYMVLCRNCMIANDVRFRIKNKINYISNCSLKEQKGYKVMRILFDARNLSSSYEDLIYPIRYYSFLYDQIVILTDKREIFEQHFSYDPTVIITETELNTSITYKKSFLLKEKQFSKEILYKELEITEEIVKNYFSNF